MNRRPWLQRSLLRQVMVSLALTNVATILLALGWFYIRFESLSRDLQDTSLISRAEEIVEEIQVGDDGAVALTLPKAMERGFSAPNGTNRYTVRDETGAVLASSAMAAGPPPEHVASGEHGTLYSRYDRTDQQIRMVGVARKLKLRGRRLTVQVEEAAGPQQALVRTLMEKVFEENGWLMLAGLFLPLLVSILIMRRAMAPVAALSGRVAEITPGNGIRLCEARLPGEILPLVRAVNSAFDRLAEAFRVQRDFTAGAAHELRTPLAVLMAHLDSLNDQAVADPLRQDVAVMAHVVEQLLRVAEIEGQPPAEPGETTDLNAIAAEVVGFMAPLAIREGKEIELLASEPPALVHGRARPIYHAVRNLVANALTHTPARTTVVVSVAVSTAGAVLSVRDHGPGIPPEQRDKIFERFWRADRRTSGSGLGLYIVRRVMQLHGGGVTVGDAEGGGAVFTLSFVRSDA